MSIPRSFKGLSRPAQVAVVALAALVALIIAGNLSGENGTLPGILWLAGMASLATAVIALGVTLVRFLLHRQPKGARR
jgi:hypothetical protein